jgi:hypothetical protein
MWRLQNPPSASRPRRRRLRSCGTTPRINFGKQPRPAREFSRAFLVAALLACGGEPKKSPEALKLQRGVFASALAIQLPAVNYKADITTEGETANIQSAKIRLATFDALGELGHSKGVIGEEHEGPPPCSGRLLLLPPPDCRRSDARSGMARTSPTSDARRASSRSGRGVPPSRGVALQG